MPDSKGVIFRMKNDAEFAPVPLYHGTSSHFLASFKPGTAPDVWLYKDVALNLLRDAWSEVSHRREQVPIEIRNEILWDINFDKFPFYVKNMICQATGPSANWQHGEIYVALSRSAAVSYARDGARYGGELLTWGKKALDILATLDQEKAEELTLSGAMLHSLLQGTELPPILVEFTGVNVECLTLETERSYNAREFFLSHTEEFEETDEVILPYENFRLASGCGTVKRVFEIHDAADNSSCPFSLREIHSHERWH